MRSLEFIVCVVTLVLITAYSASTYTQESNFNSDHYIKLQRGLTCLN